MQPVLALLPLSDAFADVWARIASAAGARSVEIDSLGELPALRDACALLLAAGAAEEAALQLLEEQLDPLPIPVAVVGTSDDYRLVASLCRAGAKEYFSLPGDLGLLHSWLGERVEAKKRGRSIPHDFQENFAAIIGNSIELQKALSTVARLIPRSDTTVLITGETGTGKDLLANAIHSASTRGTKPFVDINCAAFPPNLLEAELFGYEKGAFTDAKSAKPGLFEVANGGTVFLDEIGDLSLELQPKLLRVLETNKVRRLGSVNDIHVNFRIIAATHRNLSDLVKEQRFREDLFYRINVIQTHLPPLRDRGADVITLANRFVADYSQKYGVPEPTGSREWENALLQHSWPGNIRELKNAVERAVLLGDGVLSKEFIVADLRHGQTGHIESMNLQSVIEKTVMETLKKFNGNKKRTAEALGVSRKYLYKMLTRQSR